VQILKQQAKIIVAKKQKGRQVATAAYLEQKEQLEITFSRTTNGQGAES
jgi:hypothetical protein